MNALAKEIEDSKKYVSSLPVCRSHLVLPCRYYIDEPAVESPGAMSTPCFRRP